MPASQNHSGAGGIIRLEFFTGELGCHKLGHRKHHLASFGYFSRSHENWRKVRNVQVLLMQGILKSRPDIRGGVLVVFDFMPKVWYKKTSPLILIYFFTQPLSK